MNGSPIQVVNHHLKPIKWRYAFNNLSRRGCMLLNTYRKEKVHFKTYPDEQQTQHN